METKVQEIWHKIDELKVALSGNPSVPIAKCRALVQEMEKLIIQIRGAEIERRGN